MPPDPKTYVPGMGNGTARIAIVGEAPFYDEVAAGKPFVGPSGRFMNGLLREAGINREECWVTNVCKYLVPASPKGKKIPFHVRAAQAGINLEEEINNTRVELQAIDPNLIIAFGDTALYNLTGKKGIQKWRGSKVLAFGIKCIPTFHPAHILHQEGEAKGYWQKHIMLFDLKRAHKEQWSKELVLPRRTLQIARNSSDLHEFIKSNDLRRKPSIDIEAYQCIPMCIGISFDRSYGITVPLWEKYFKSGISTSDLTSMWVMLAQFLHQHNIVGQNFGYDRDKIKRLGFVIKGLASDTMLKSFVISPELPKNLAFNTSIYTEEPYYKDEGMYEGSAEDLMIGCARDACVTKEIDEEMDIDIDKLELRDYYENFVLPLHDLYADIEQTGFLIDHGIRKELIKKYVTQDEEVRYKLFKLTGEYVNSNSPKQVSKLLYEKLGLPERQGTGEEVLTSLLNAKYMQKGKETEREIINLILEDRRIKKTLSTTLTAPIDFDGRMKTSYFVCLETGRSSTSSLGPPIRPQVMWIDENGKKKDRDIGVAFQTITKHGDIGSDVRKMIVAG